MIDDEGIDRSKIPLNMKMREMYCPECHIYSQSDLPIPKCYNCKTNLITVARSALTGERITGRRK